MSRFRHFQMGILAACWATALAPGVIRANAGISIEAIDAYPNCNPLANNKANADGFRNRMTSIAGYTNGIRYVDSLVYLTDFLDPDRPGGSGGRDHSNFDRQVDAISYFSGHGSCNDQTLTTCAGDADCPLLAGLNARCTRFSESPLSGKCEYSRPRVLLANKNGNPCNTLNYSTGGVAFGESDSFPWAGMGIDGGINFAIMDVSCAITPTFYVEQTINAFAGMSTAAFIMPTRVGSDTVDVSNRGRAFADRYVANPNSAMAVQWAASINSVTGGSACAFGGGSHGIAGCGAHIAISSDSNDANAQFSNRTETWIQYRDENNDARGTGSAAWILTCNYDCNTHDFTF